MADTTFGIVKKVKQQKKQKKNKWKKWKYGLKILKKYHKIDLMKRLISKKADWPARNKSLVL